MNFAEHFVRQSIGLVVVVLIGFFQPLAAQTETLTPSGVIPGAISCAPSGNGIGHMECLEYSTSGLLIGLSWQAPPAASARAEINDTIDVENKPPFTAAVGTLIAAPACAAENDDVGTIACLLVSQSTSGEFTLQGVAFAPPVDKVGTTTPTGLMQLGTEPANAVIGNPSCSTAGSAGAIVCAIPINGQLIGVGFEPKANIATALTTLLSGASITGNPSCAAAANTHVIPSTCAIREGSSLVGFAFTFTPPPSPVIATEDTLTLGTMTFSGDPSCAIPADGPVAAMTSFVATCGIVSGTALFGISFDPIDAIPTSATASHTTGLQSLGNAPGTNSWTGHISCAGIADFRRGIDPNLNNFPNASPNKNLVNCAATSATANVFAVTFDPRLPSSRGVTGPFGGNAPANLSCLFLNVDHDNTYCGGITQAGASVGYTIPVGILPSGVVPVLQQFVSN